MRLVILPALAASFAVFAQSAPAPTSAPAAGSSPASSSPAPAAAPTSSPAAAAIPAPAIPVASEPVIPDYREGTVYLFDGAKFTALEPNRPAIVPRMAFMVALVILKLPGAQAETRTKNPTPYLLIGGKTVGGHLVHFSIDSAPADPHRETRLKSELEITASDLVNFKDEKLESGWHKISAYHPLAPGEYAWIPYLSNGAGLMGVIDFGIDKP